MSDPSVKVTLVLAGGRLDVEMPLSVAHAIQQDRQAGTKKNTYTFGDTQLFLRLGEIHALVIVTPGQSFVVDNR